MIFMVAFLFACSHKSADKNTQKSPQNKIEVKLIGEVRTRRSYAHIQFMHNEKAIDSYLEKQRKTNPTLDYQPDSISRYLIKQFEKLGLIKNEELLLRNFKKQTGEKTVYTDSSGREISLVFYHNQVTDRCHFKLLFAADSIEINTEAGTMQDLDYAFLDVNPGGNKELVFLDDYYIMNGDNFNFKVYEIKIK